MSSSDSIADDAARSAARFVERDTSQFSYRHWNVRTDNVLRKLDIAGSDKTAIKDTHILCLHYQMECRRLKSICDELQNEKQILTRYVNKYCLGKSIVSVCYDCNRNVGCMDQTYEEMSSYPCCTDSSHYVEIDDWVKENNVDIEEIKREHQRNISTPLYQEEDPSPSPPDEN
jgi:hypothetical protein